MNLPAPWLSPLLALCLAGAVACGADMGAEEPPTGPADDLGDSSDDTEEDDAPTDMTPVRLQAEADDQTLELGQSVILSVWAVNAVGDVVADSAEAALSVDPADVVEIGDATQSGGVTMVTVTGLEVGSATITANAGTLTSPALNFQVSAGAAGQCESPADLEVVCDGKYYRCGPEEPWLEATEGACTPSTPENCSCGHFLELVTEGDGYCVDEEPAYPYEPTCDCSYCVPNAG